MCSLQDIDRAVEIFKKAACPIMLMHSVSTYPAADKDLNLSVMHVLRERYGLPVGYSGHEVSVSPSIMAAVMGAMAKSGTLPWTGPCTAVIKPRPWSLPAW